jgi:hypothetical protein
MNRRVAVWTAGMLALAAGAALACGPFLNFREYLDARLWQNLPKVAEDFARKREPALRPFAGMSPESPKEPLDAVRKAYQPFGDPSTHEDLESRMAKARTAVEAALRSSALSEREKWEVRLVDCKLDLREGEREDPDALERAGRKLLTFIKETSDPALRSEARGWLARVHYLRHEYPAAAKIYLDELARADSNLGSDVLTNSLRMMFPYNGSDARLEDHLEEMFDTPAHALFAVQLVTNPVTSDPELKVRPAVVRKVIAALERRRELFRLGKDSDALALALMRAALHSGDGAATLRYGALLPQRSPARDSSEYLWLTAAGDVLEKNHAAAEKPLLRLCRSRTADARTRRTAAQALQGVYHTLGRNVEQLHAAFLFEGTEVPKDYSERALGFWLWWGGNLDLPYLLDVQVSDDELREYLKRYPGPVGTPLGRYKGPRRSAPEVVRYSLAVRHARHEQYAEAAALFESIAAARRSVRMRVLAKLHARSQDPSLVSAERLAARYEYAEYLAHHSTQVFFNDLLWSGFQTWALADGPLEKGRRSSQEKASLAEQERHFKDEQEEYWRAYKILAGVAEEVGPTELGRRAARTALWSLERINTDRFGREREIDAAKARWTRWLRSSRQRTADHGG